MLPPLFGGWGVQCKNKTLVCDELALGGCFQLRPSGVRLWPCLLSAQWCGAELKVHTPRGLVFLPQNGSASQWSWDRHLLTNREKGAGSLALSSVPACHKQAGRLPLTPLDSHQGPHAKPSMDAWFLANNKCEMNKRRTFQIANNHSSST